MRQVDRQYIRDIGYLYRLAKEFSNRLRIDEFVDRNLPRIGLDVFSSENFQEHVVRPIYQDLSHKLPWEALRREKLAKIISLGCSDLPGERESMHVFERFAIDDAVEEYDAHRSRTSMSYMDRTPQHLQHLPASSWYCRGEWDRMNGIQRLQFQAALVIAAAIRDLAFARYRRNKDKIQYTPRLPRDLQAVLRC